MTNMSLNSLSKESYSKQSGSYPYTKSTENLMKVKNKFSPNKPKEAPMKIIFQPYDIANSFNHSKFSKASMLDRMSQSSAEKINMAT